MSAVKPVTVEMALAQASRAVEAAREAQKLALENQSLVRAAIKQRDAAHDALAGLYGLLQLFAGRDDVPADVKNFASNHRAVEALAVLERMAT